MTLNWLGALAFGLVVGWVTYRTIRRSSVSGLSDIATVIGAVGGGAITKLFPAESGVFGAYGIGLAAGFFLYLITAVIVAGKTTGLSAVNEWLGDSLSSVANSPRSGPVGSIQQPGGDIPAFPARPPGR